MFFLNLNSKCMTKEKTRRSGFFELGCAYKLRYRVTTVFYIKSNLSAFITFTQAETKSVTNFSLLSSWA